MKRSVGLPAIAAVSLVLTYLFFMEYLPPLRRVHIPYDLDGFHYPLVDYAFQSLRQGRFPEWDATIYCGISFVGNIQAGLFYPPDWLLFAVNAGRTRLSFMSLQILMIAHVWLGFLLCYLWLRYRGIKQLAAVLGAGGFAYGGYMLLQLQHQGLVCAYAWMPLGLWGIDQAVATRHWRPLWKTAAVSALAFLAGYPPTWAAYCVMVLTYALAGAGRWRIASQTALALAASIPLVAVQLLPVREAATMKDPELRYGLGVRAKETYLGLVLPNYCDFKVAGPIVPWQCEYLYLGAPIFFGLAGVVRRQFLRAQVPLLAAAAVSLVFVTNPLWAVWNTVKHFPLLAELLRDWYFMPGFLLPLVALGAHGLDEFLARDSKAPPRGLVFSEIAVLVAWAAWEWYVWLPGGRELPSGWASGIYTVVTLALFSFAIFLVRGESGAARSWLIAAMLLSVWTDYKTLGTSRSFDAGEGNVDSAYKRGIAGMDYSVFRELRDHSDYRVAVDTTGPFAQMLRVYGLRAAQGFDPFLPSQYRARLQGLVNWESDRIFFLNPANTDLLRQLGVRYLITADHPQAAMLRALTENPRFRRIEPSNTFYKAYDLSDPQPAYRWADRSSTGSIDSLTWLPERREFRVRSDRGGRFVLVEQFFPGWRATIDGKPASIERWDGAFQAVEVPPGEHRLTFEFRSTGLRIGALISAVSLAAFVFLVLKSPKAGKI